MSIWSSANCWISYFKRCKYRSKRCRWKKPLNYACFHGYLPIVEFFLSKGANIEAKDKEGNTSHHYGCFWDELPTVEFLILKDVNIEAKDKDEETPLHLAWKFDETDVVKYLVSKGANKNAKIIKGKRP